MRKKARQVALRGYVALKISATWTICGLICSGLLLILFTSQSVEASSAKRKVILLAVDGLTERVITPLIRQHQLKNIEHLRVSGSYGKFSSIEPTFSPALWTSVATGKNRKDHGIPSFFVLDASGMKVLANGSNRKTKALWNILSEDRLKVGTIGYFCTWPAEEINGYMISDVSVFPVEKGFYPQEMAGVMRQVLPASRYLEYALFEGQHSTNDGVVHFFGADIKPRNLINGFSLLDITPVVLKLLNLPLSRDLAGKVPPSLFKPKFLSDHPDRYIKSYDEVIRPLKQTTHQKSPVDEALKKQLRSLGYIQ